MSGGGSEPSNSTNSFMADEFLDLYGQYKDSVMGTANPGNNYVGFGDTGNLDAIINAGGSFNSGMQAGGNLVSQGMAGLSPEAMANAVAANSQAGMDAIAKQAENVLAGKLTNIGQAANTTGTQNSSRRGIAEGVAASDVTGQMAQAQSDFLNQQQNQYVNQQMGMIQAGSNIQQQNLNQLFQSVQAQGILQQMLQEAADAERQAGMSDEEWQQFQLEKVISMALAGASLRS